MSADNWTDCPKCKAIGRFREDYEQGIVEEIYEIKYSGFCNECKFTFKFKHQEDVLKERDKIIIDSEGLWEAKLKEDKL